MKNDPPDSRCNITNYSPDIRFLSSNKDHLNEHFCYFAHLISHCMKFLGIIPARYGSTRLEGKPLADIGGKPMIRHV